MSQGCWTGWGQGSPTHLSCRESCGWVTLRAPRPSSLPCLLPHPFSRVPSRLPACLPHLGIPPQVALENQSRTASWAPGLGSQTPVGTVGSGPRPGRTAVRGRSGRALGEFGHHQCVQNARFHCVLMDRWAARQHTLRAQARVPLRAHGQTGRQAEHAASTGSGPTACSWTGRQAAHTAGTGLGPTALRAELGSEIQAAAFYIFSLRTSSASRI